MRPYRCALVCIDGVYSMSGKIPPMAELDRVARAGSAVLYIDDAHGTGVLGEHGRGTVLEALGSYENAFVVGSLSKAFSCAGGFIGCSGAISAAAQDSLEPVRLRRAGRSRLSGSDRHGDRHPLLELNMRRCARGSTASIGPLDREAWLPWAWK